MQAGNGLFYPRPAKNASGTGVSGTALSITSTAAVDFTASTVGTTSSVFDIVTIDIQTGNTYVTFDGSTPSAGAAHILYVGEKADWNKATFLSAKFVATTTTNSIIYATPFQI